ncbi:MAG: ABC transporter permease [Salinivirgaceae bacterium]
MQLLFKTLKWDVFLLYKYGIVAVALGISAIYSLLLLSLDTAGLEKLVAILIFSDPVMYGFLFTAVMILFEKEAQTHQVLAVTPLSTGGYIWSKALAFTLLALITSFLIMLAAHPAYFNVFWFVLAICLSSLLFIFIGIVGVSFVQNFNQFILIIPIVLAPICLPFLHYFGLSDSWLYYVIPSQACLILFAGSVSKVAGWQLFYAVVYLLALNYLTYRWAYSSYNKRILKTNRK